MATTSLIHTPAPYRSTIPLYRRSVLVDPPDSAEPFAWDNGSVLRPGGVPVEMPAVGATVVIVSFIVPQNRSGMVQRYANGSLLGGGVPGWVNGNGQLVWQILRNGTPVKNMRNIITIRGLVENGGAPLPRGIHVRANDTVSLVLINFGVAPAGQTLLGLLAGYYYPQELDPSGVK
jgi:hypothetical protein